MKLNKNMQDISKFKTVLLKTIKKTGDSILKDYETLDRGRVKLKTKRDLVTAADLKSEKIIIASLKKNFPDHQILSEESGLSTKHGDYLWIIDPLDGTTNFYIHNPIWSVSIALAYRSEVILGAIYAPLQKELFFAEKGRGAYLNNKKIAVKKSAKKIINAFCHGREIKNIKRIIKYFAYQKLHALDCRQLGSAAIETAYVAAGRITSVLMPGVWPWDVAAGTLLIREAGGRVTDFKGREWKIKGRDFLATNGKIHQEILGIIKKIKI